jgi:WD40 repeat protein
MAFSGDGRLLALAVDRSSIELVALPGGESLGQLTGPDRCTLVALAFSRDGRILAAAGLKNLAMLWDLGEVAAQLSALKLGGRLPVHPPSAPVNRSVELTIEPSETNNP